MHPVPNCPPSSGGTCPCSFKERQGSMMRKEKEKKARSIHFKYQSASTTLPSPTAVGGCGQDNFKESWQQKQQGHKLPSDLGFLCTAPILRRVHTEFTYVILFVTTNTPQRHFCPFHHTCKFINVLTIKRGGKNQ